MLWFIRAVLLAELLCGCLGAPVNSDFFRGLGSGRRGGGDISHPGVVFDNPPEKDPSLNPSLNPRIIHDAYQDVHLDMAETRMMAMLISIVYCHNETSLKSWTCFRCKDPLIEGFVVHEIVSIDSWDFFGYIGYFPKTNAKVIVFRGTNEHSLWNWVEDLRAERSSYPLGIPGTDGAYVHTGFFTLWNSSGAKARMTMALAELMEKTGWGGTLYVGGHSMGAAVASLCALYMKYMFDLQDVRVYTFGSPRVGNTDFVKVYEKMTSVSVRMTHMADIVPSVPLTWFGYHHFPREVWQTDVFNSTTNTTEFHYKICNGSGEDPSCHLSVCGWAICRNITQHKWYMGMPMHNEHEEC
ncbi:hypothetical protein BSKO_03166 [Bryopsis sp. KO-2023]|nr:hypothetical protein BSKO_03166 [Bryopsis sp. KO-2023]